MTYTKPKELGHHPHCECMSTLCNNLCVCMCVCVSVYNVPGSMTSYAKLFPWARNLTHISPTYPAVYNGDLVSTGPTQI